MEEPYQISIVRNLENIPGIHRIEADYIEDYDDWIITVNLGGFSKHKFSLSLTDALRLYLLFVGYRHDILFKLSFWQLLKEKIGFLKIRIEVLLED